jgi:hypothetical protein
MIELYRRRPGLLLGTALAVFVPLNAVRYPFIDARWYPVALTLTLVGHLALVAILRRRPDLDVAPIRPRLAALGLVVVTGLQVVLGQAVEAVVGMSTFGIMLGGFVPSVLLGPAWALLVIGALAARRHRATVSP